MDRNVRQRHLHKDHESRYSERNMKGDPDGGKENGKGDIRSGMFLGAGGGIP